MKAKKDKWTGRTVKVDWKHIAKGEPQEPNSCPIAYALKELGAREVSVADEVITIGNKEYEMPAVAERFVSTFDEERTEAKPITFKIGNRIAEDKVAQRSVWDW